MPPFSLHETTPFRTADTLQYGDPYTLPAPTHWFIDGMRELLRFADHCRANGIDRRRWSATGLAGFFTEEEVRQIIAAGIPVQRHRRAAGTGCSVPVTEAGAYGPPPAFKE